MRNPLAPVVKMGMGVRKRDSSMQNDPVRTGIPAPMSITELT
jgi:hypothetical protein